MMAGMGAGAGTFGFLHRAKTLLTRLRLSPILGFGSGHDAPHRRPSPPSSPLQGSVIVSHAFGGRNKVRGAARDGLGFYRMVELPARARGLANAWHRIACLYRGF
jgi:hypothetical protein